MKKIFNDINEMKEHYKLLQETLDIFDNRFKRKNPYKNSTYKQLKRLNINEILKEIMVFGKLIMIMVIYNQK